MEVLVTGTGSGLGRFIYEEIGTVRWDRDTPSIERQRLTESGVDVIIHCAFNSSRVINSDNLAGYLWDNVLLPSQLVSIPHQKFIFISTVDVYPKDGFRHFEDEIVDLNDPNRNDSNRMYAISKLEAESLVRERSLDHLILRCTGLLGRFSRRNALIRMMEEANCSLTLSGDSSFNYILYSDVFSFIQQAIEGDIQGIFNLASSANMTVLEIARVLGKQVNFGSYYYDVGNIDSTKAQALCPAFVKTTAQVISEFALARTSWQ